MFAIVLGLVALLIAFCAAVFSVTGIAKLFAGATIAATIMASSLEAGKLVTVSYLYRYWKEIPRLFRTYLIIASIILMMITSMGIYGYLTSAYAKVAAVPQATLNQMSLIDNQKITIQNQLKSDHDRLSQLDQSRQTTQATLSEVVGKLQYGNNTTTHNAQRQLDYINSQEASLQSDISNLTHRLDSLDVSRTQFQNQLTSDEKIGTFIYVANALNVPLDTVVKWFTFILVLVFDPLSVSLVVAYNSLVKKKILADLPPSQWPSAKDILQKRKKDVAVEKEIPIEESPAPITPADPGPQRKSGVNYYQEDSYDWEHDHRWKNDPQAIAWRQARGR